MNTEIINQLKEIMTPIAQKIGEGKVNKSCILRNSIFYRISKIGGNIL